MTKPIKNTFLGEISACFFWTWWYNCAASFSQTWHLMYGISSFLATVSGFLEQRETGTHADTSSTDTTTKSTDLIFAINKKSPGFEENKKDFQQTVGEQNLLELLRQPIWSYREFSPKFYHLVRQTPKDWSYVQYALSLSLCLCFATTYQQEKHKKREQTFCCLFVSDWLLRAEYSGSLAFHQ